MDELVKIGGFKRGHLSVNRTLILAVISLKADSVKHIRIKVSINFTV